MIIKVRLSTVLLIAAIITLVLLGLNASTNVLASGQARPDPQIILPPAVPGGPGFVSINGGTFTPTLSTSMSWGVLDGEIYNTDKIFDAGFVAPVMLPQGAKVLKLVAYYSDTTTLDLEVGLYRKPLGAQQTMAFVKSTGTGGYGYGVDDSINFATVDNQQFSYFAKALIPAWTVDKFDLSLVGIRVDYSYPEYLPLVSK